MSDDRRMADFGERVLQPTRDVIEAHLAVRDRWNPAEELASMTRHAVHDYGGRFLLELIQNGYDAHPDQCVDGRISIVLDEQEGPFGVLYVANSGTPFTASNYQAIRRLGMSDKAPGESIGNKGVGFKSVLQVADRPEVYSADPDQPFAGELDGFCFGLAEAADLEMLLDVDSATARLVCDEVPPFALTVPRPKAPPTAVRLAADGHVTVVRLVLRSVAAREQARQALASLRHSEVPVLLFLPRLRRLLFEHHRADGDDSRELTRQAEPLDAPTADGVSMNVIDLGTAGRFLVADRIVPANRLSAAIDAGIGEEQLDEMWRDWEQPAVVSVAVPLGQDMTDFRMYAFLPLGKKARPPFPGHLNAPFRTFLNRTDLGADEHLNRLFIEVAAEACLLAVDRLTHAGARDTRTAAADLVSWDANHVDLLQAVCQRLFGQDLAARPLLPAETASGPGWASPAEARRWPAGSWQVLSRSAAVPLVDAPLLDDDLGQVRTRRLERWTDALGLSLAPTADRLAGWIERLVATFPADTDSARWYEVYDELSKMFEREPAALHGRRVLLDASGRLRPCNTPADSGRRGSRPSSAFFPAVRGRVEGEEEVGADADLRIPEQLAGRMFYLHPDLRWTTNANPPQRTRARRWLEDNRLVRRFDVRGLLDHARDALRSRTDPALARAVLQFVFRVHAARPGRQLELDQLGLRVPLATGDWVPATDALFSARWPKTAGAQVETLLRGAVDVSADLVALQSRLLAPPADVVPPGDDVGEWAGFLRRIGVTDWLTPVPMPVVRPSLTGEELTASGLAAFLALTDVEQLLWREHFGGLAQRAQYPLTPYVSATPGYRLPGQQDHHRLPADAKSAFAELLIRGLDVWPDECLRMTFQRDRPGEKDAKVVPTLLDAFLVRGRWLESRRPGQASAEFTAPADAWVTDDEDADNARRFSPLVPVPLRRLILESSRRRQRLTLAGLGMWSEPRHAGRLIWHHGRLLADGQIPDLETGAFGRSHRAAWARLTGQPNPTLSGDDKPRYLAVERGDRLTAIPVDGEASEVVYVSDNAAASSGRILRGLGLNLLAVHERAEIAAQLLGRDTGLGVRAMADVATGVLLDDKPFVPAAGAPALVESYPWLPTLVGLAIEYRTPFLRLAETGFQDTMDRLRRLRLTRAATIQVKIGDQALAVPEGFREVFPIPDPTWPTLVLPAESAQAGWAELKSMAGALCELIRRPQLVESLRLSIMELDQLGADVQRGPDTDELTNVFNLTPDHVGDIRRRANHQVAAVVYRIYPVAVLLCGQQAAAPLDPTMSSIDDEHTLAAAVHNLPLSGDITADTLLREAADASTPYDLRDSFGIDFGAFNRTLQDLAPTYTPQLLRDDHRDVFGFFVAQHRPMILDRLRTARLERFDRAEPQPDWPALRALPQLDPDERWLLDYRTPPDDLMQERVETWLTAHAAAVAADPQLPPLESVQQANRALVAAWLPRAAAAVQVWSASRQQAVPDWWIRRAASPAEAVDELDQAGAMDFRYLDEPSLINWLTALRRWPAAMPPSLDPPTLGIRPEDLDSAKSVGNLARLERARQRRIVRLDEQEIDVGGHDYQDLHKMLIATVGDQDPFPARSTRFTPLTAITNPPRRSSTGHSFTGGGRVRSAGDSVSDEQRDAIGFVGEWLAYQWLRHRYPTTSPDSWISSYRRHVFPGHPGNDDAGYDFRVVLANDLYFEVKATQGALGEFELGESQVREVQRRTHEDRWRIVVISHVLSTEHRRLEVLPNPFSRRGRDRFQLVGRGLRFRYTVTEG